MAKAQTINLKGTAARGFMFALYQDRIRELESENARLTADMQAVRVILRDFWQLLDLGGESWGRSFRGQLAEIAMGLLDLHFEYNHLLGTEFEKDPESFVAGLWDRIQQKRFESARRAVAGEGEPS